MISHDLMVFLKEKGVSLPSDEGNVTISVSDLMQAMDMHAMKATINVARSLRMMGMMVVKYADSKDPKFEQFCVDRLSDNAFECVSEEQIKRFWDEYRRIAPSLSHLGDHIGVPIQIGN